MMVGMFEVKLYGPENSIVHQWQCTEREVRFELNVQRGQRFSWSDLQDVLMALSETVGEYQIARDVGYEVRGLGAERNEVVAVGSIFDESTEGVLSVM